MDRYMRLMLHSAPHHRIVGVYLYMELDLHTQDRLDRTCKYVHMVCMLVVTTKVQPVWQVEKTEKLDIPRDTVLWTGPLLHMYIHIQVAYQA